MTTTTTASATAGAPPARRPGIAWGLGPLVGLVAVVGVTGSGAGFSVTDDLPVRTMIGKLEAAASSLLLVGAAQALGAMALVVFGAWLQHRLRGAGPDGSILPTVAGGGAFLTAACMAVAAMHTQLVGEDAAEAVDPAVPLALHTLEENLFAGAWCSLALAAGAVAVAAFRHRIAPAWLGGVSAFFAVLLVILQVVVPWGGWFPAAIWLIAAGIGLRRVAPGPAAD